MKIGNRTGAILIAWFVLSVLGLLTLEAVTLADATPLNHITAVVRQAFHAQPGVFVWLAFSVGFLCGHLFWGGKR